jgi:Kef-type K+ transport system membrane component KefB
MRQTATFYTLLVVVPIALILGILRIGAGLEKAPAAGPAGAVTSPIATGAGETSLPGRVLGNLAENVSSPLARLVLQILVIVIAARLLGWLFGRLGQPAVMGEIVAGVLLGPSLFGAVAPGAFAVLFDPGSLGSLKLLAEVGVLVFMFVVGLELDLTAVRRQARAALVVSHASIVVPYLLGVLLALLLYRSYAPPGVRFDSFALFMGIAMSITAFPVLARILEDRGLSKTPLGSTAITCAAVGDVSAWSILALVVAIARSAGVAAAAATIALSACFIVFVWKAVKPALARLLGSRLDAEHPPRWVVAAVLMVVMGAAFTTEAIGIHALFGAFLAGLIMPVHPHFRDKLTERLESFSSVLLLPLFFAFTGLRTQFGLLSDLDSWWVCPAVIGVATLGKLGGSMIAARWAGMSWNDSFSLGALMNTRGLMELIALNVGYELGILSPEMFSILVLMAVVTTFLTAPMLSLAQRYRHLGTESNPVNESTSGEPSPARSPLP